MSDPVTVFWSFRSPYSYIALPRLVALSKKFEVTLDMRIVHPVAMRNPDYFRTMNPLARPYFMMDSARASAFHGLPFRRPMPDPITQDQVTLALTPEQPLARRLGCLGIAATARGCGPSFCLEISRLLWDGSVDGWNEGDRLAQAAARAGLELAELEAVVNADPAYHEKALALNDQALRAAGHWGVPTMVYRGETFFGQDRIDMLAWRLEANAGPERCGLRHASASAIKSGSMSEFPEIHPLDASPEIAAIYADTRSVSGVPMVNLIWRHFAAVPGVIPLIRNRGAIDSWDTCKRFQQLGSMRSVELVRRHVMRRELRK